MDLIHLIQTMFDAENMEKWKTVNVLVVNRLQCKTGDDTWCNIVHTLILVLLTLILGIVGFPDLFGFLENYWIFRKESMIKDQ